MKNVWQRLLQRYGQKKMPHAMCLVGFGDEKILLGQALEQLLLCYSPKKDSACGVCRSCFLYHQQIHPDSRHFGNNDQGISIDDIRELIHFVSKTSHQQGCQVVTLHQADKLSIASANALLKTFEEPPEKTFFILMTKKQSALLPTLKSRCFVINVPTQNTVHLHSQLSSKWNVALINALLEQTNFDHEDIQHFITEQPQEALYLMYCFLTDGLRSRLQCPTGFLYNTDHISKLQNLMQRVTSLQIGTFLDSVNEAMQTLSFPGINKQLLFEALFYQWQQMAKE